jgi:hypothetical protein
MDASEKYLNWMEGSLRKTISIALRKSFKDIQIEDEDARGTLLSLSDGFIRNQINISEGKRW